MPELTQDKVVGGHGKPVPVPELTHLKQAVPELTYLKQVLCLS